MLTWNRKRGQFLLGLELLVCFLLIAALATVGVSRLPEFPPSPGLRGRGCMDRRVQGTSRFPYGRMDRGRFHRHAAGDPHTEEHAGGRRCRRKPHPAAVGFNIATSALHLPGQESRQCYYTEAGMDLAKVLRLDMARGRWFDATDLPAAKPHTTYLRPGSSQRRFDEIDLGGTSGVRDKRGPGAGHARQRRSDRQTVHHERERRPRPHHRGRFRLSPAGQVRGPALVEIPPGAARPAARRRPADELHDPPAAGHAASVRAPVAAEAECGGARNGTWISVP